MLSARRIASLLLSTRFTAGGPRTVFCLAKLSSPLKEWVPDGPMDIHDRRYSCTTLACAGLPCQAPERHGFGGSEGMRGETAVLRVSCSGSAAGGQADQAVGLATSLLDLTPDCRLHAARI